MVSMKMKKFYKLLFGEIRFSFNRFISILAIVALGAGFLAGLDATTPNMRDSVDAYYDATAFHDIRVVSTLGLTEEDVEALRAVWQERGAVVEAAYSQDQMTASSDGEEYATRFLSLGNGVNLGILREGRMPEEADECLAVLDDISRVYDVGDVIEVCAEEDETGLAYDSYRVVGMIELPMYMSMERDSASIGSGKIATIICLPRDGFDLDVYTDIYAVFDSAGAEDGFGEKYDAVIDSLKEKAEAIADERAAIRLTELRADANAELDDARAELAEEREKAYAELADAEIQLADAEAEYADGLAKIEEAEAELADAEAELADGAKQLADGERELDEGEAEISEKYAELRAGLEELNEAEMALAEGEAAYEEGRLKLAEGQAQLDAGRAALSLKKAELDAGIAAYEAGLLQYEDGLAQYEAGIAAYEASLEEYNAGFAAYEEGLAQYETSLAQYEAAKDQLPEVMRAETEAKLAAAAAELEATKTALDAGATELEEGRATLDVTAEEMERAKLTLEQTKKTLDEGEAAIADAQSELAGSQVELDAGAAELAASRTQLDEGWEELNRGKAEIEEGRIALDEAAAEIEAGRAELAEKKAELADAQVQITDGYAEIAENRAKLADAAAEIEKARAELADGYAEAEKKLADAEAEIAEAQADIDAIEQPEWYILDRNANISYVSFDGNAEKVAVIAKVFPIFFYLVAALVALTTMTRMVEEERSQIGTLKTLGYSDGAIMFKYIFYAGAASVLGCALGLCIGFRLFPIVIWQAYDMMYILPELLTPFRWGSALLISAVSILATVGAAASAAYSSVKETPASILRPKAPKAGKRIFLEGIKPLWSRLSFTQKVTARNLVRYKKRFLMTVIGISGCTALLLAGFGLRNSIGDIIHKQYGELQTYGLTIGYDAEADGASLDAILADRTQITDHIPVMQKSAALVDGDGVSYDVFLQVPGDAVKFTNFTELQERKSGAEIAFGDGAAVLTEKLASILGVRAGDEVTLEEGERRYTVTVTGITENYVNSYLYMAPDVYEAMTGTSAEANLLLAKTTAETKASEALLGEALMKCEAVTAVSFTADTSRTFDDMLSKIDYIVVVLIISAAVLAVVVMYNLTNINITERKGELATIKVLGFFDGEVAMYIYRENIVLTVIGCAVGLLVGIALHAFVVQTAEVDIVMFGREIKAFSYVISAVMTVVFSLFVNMIMLPVLRAIDMVESMKAND